MLDNTHNAALAFPTNCAYQVNTENPLSYHGDSTIPSPGKGIPRKGYLAPVEQVLGARKAEFIEAIQLWTDGQRQRQKMSPCDVGGYEGFHRLLLIRNSFVANVIALCRSNPRQDCRMAVLALIEFLSDNEDFVCHLSIKRMAQILVRKEENIRLAILYLEEQGVISVKRSRGLLNTYSPCIPNGLDDVTAAVVWFADALSEKPPLPGRPPKAPRTGGSGEEPPKISHNTQESGSQTTTKVEKMPTTKVEKTPPVDRKNPPRRAVQYITKLDHSELAITIMSDSVRERIREPHENRASRALSEVCNHG